MENREKYYDLFKSNLKVGSVRDLGCALYVIKTKGEDNCPKGIDCKESCLETFEWFYEEYIPNLQKEYNEKGTLDGKELETT